MKQATRPASIRDVIAANIARLRRKQGLSQPDLAHGLRWLGIAWTRATVAQVETGRRQVSFAEALALAAELDVPIAELLATDAEAITVGEGTWHGAYLGAVVSGETGGLPVERTYTSVAMRSDWDRMATLAPTVMALRAERDQAFSARWGLDEKMSAQRFRNLQNPGTVERDAAVRLRLRTNRRDIEASDVAAAAHVLGWHTVADEQARRVAGRVRAGGAARAYKGHVMRELDKELGEKISAVNAAAPAVTRRLPKSPR